MQKVSSQWQHQVDELWNAFDTHEAETFVRKMEALAAQLPAGHPIGLFELGGAWDSTGHSDRAIPLYRAALAAGLDACRAKQATIQMASSLRNVGEKEEAVALLGDALKLPEDGLTPAVRGFLALALSDVGRDREALMHALTALSGYLPQYNRSMKNYAAALIA